MMDCRRFEEALEDLSLGRLPAGERTACEAHAAACGECRALLALMALPVEAEFEAGGRETAAFLESVLARTSGAVCESTALNLPALVDGSLPPSERSLVAEHVSTCAECTDLVAVLAKLARELPSLARVQPDVRFVDDVLKRTLPVHVQLRRWWARVWPQWLHRPRFASEAAYVASLVLVLIFATPGSPLEAVPKKALAVARQPVIGELHLDSYLAVPAAAVEALAESRGAERVNGWIAAGAETADKAEDAVSEAADKAENVVAEVAERLATFWRGAASLLGNDGEDAVQESPESSESNEENP